jgi:hypothetical protein
VNARPGSADLISRRWSTEFSLVAVACVSMVVIVILMGCGSQTGDSGVSGGSSTAPPQALSVTETGVFVNKCVDLVTVSWHGSRYSSFSTLQALPIGRSLRGGLAFSKLCPDGTTQAARAARLRAIVGVAPDVALVRGGDKRTVWVGSGYLPQVAGFPLRGLIFGPNPQPIRGSCPRIGRLVVTGRVVDPPSGLLSAFSVKFLSANLRYTGPRPHFYNRQAVILVDAGTRLPHQRGTLPRLQSGQEVRVHARYCNVGSDPPVVIANRIVLG